MMRFTILLVISFFLSACATAGGTFAPLDSTHPASPDAAEVPIADPSAILRAEELPLSTERAAPAALASEHAPGAYVCPMHPEVSANAPGHCPKCGMQLVPRAVDESNEGHPHEH